MNHVLIGCVVSEMTTNTPQSRARRSAHHDVTEERLLPMRIPGYPRLTQDGREALTGNMLAASHAVSCARLTG